MLGLSKRADHLRASTTLDISASAQVLKTQGFDVISLAVGEPDLDTPKVVQEAAIKAMAEGITRYTPSQGFLKVREAVAEYIRRENDFPADPDEIILTAGAKHAIYLALQCLVQEGDAVLVPTPAWVSYNPMIELTGATMIPLPLHEEDGFQINVDRWKGMAIPPSAKGIILNSPNNPTGVVYNRRDLLKLTGWAMQRNLWILSDEIYEKIYFDGHTPQSIAGLGPEAKSCSITVSGFSKSHCMTGWRFGWAVADRDLIKKMTALQSQMNSHVTSFVQWAAIAAAKLPDTFFKKLVTTFDERRKYCSERLSKLAPEVKFTEPQGAFYFFMNLSPVLQRMRITDAEFCKRLLQEKHVALVPGAAFGLEKFARLSYAIEIERLKEAFDRLESFIQG